MKMAIAEKYLTWGYCDMFKKIIIVIGLIILAKGLVYLFVEYKPTGPMTQREVDNLVANNLTKPRDELEQTLRANEKLALAVKISQSDLESLVLAANKTYPKTSPNGIRTDRVTTGLGLISFYKTNVSATVDEFEISPNDRASWRELVMKDSCTNLGVRNLLRSGISVQVIQRDKNDLLIFDVTTRPEDCV